MPLLDFRCRQCGRQFEELVYGNDREKLACPACGCKEIDQVYQGKCYTGKTSSGACTGHCATCPGCHH